MNWSGMLFGASLALLLVGGGAAAFAPRPRVALQGLAGAMLGVAGLCLSLGNELLAVVVAAVLGLLLPALQALAIAVAPGAEGSAIPRRRTAAVAAGATLALLLGGWMLVHVAWLPAGGTRQTGAEWIGSRFLTDYLLLLDLLAALLAVAGTGAVVLLRSRARRRP